MPHEPDISISQMRKLVTIAKERSFSRAAVALSLSQPSLSRFTREFEDKFRIQLFQRHGRGVHLTVAGEHLLRALQEILDSYDLACGEIEQLAKTVRGEVTVAMLESTYRVIGLPLMRRFKSLHPHATMRITNSYSHDIQELLVSSKADFGIVCDTHSLSALQVDPLVVEDLYLIFKPGGIGEDKDEISLHEVSQLPLFLPAKGGSIRTILTRALAELHLDLNPLLDVDDNEMILDLVSEGHGFTVLPFSGIYRELKSGKFSVAKITSPPLKRKLMLAIPSNRQMSFAARQAAHLARAIVRSNCELARWKLIDGLSNGPPASGDLEQVDHSETYKAQD